MAVRILVTWVLNAIGLMIGAAFVPALDILNGLFVWLAAWIIEAGFDVDRVWQGVLLAIWLSAISITITTVLRNGAQLDAPLARGSGTRGVSRRARRLGRAVSGPLWNCSSLTARCAVLSCRSRGVRGRAANACRYELSARSRISATTDDFASA